MKELKPGTQVRNMLSLTRGEVIRDYEDFVRVRVNVRVYVHGRLLRRTDLRFWKKENVECKR